MAAVAAVSSSVATPGFAWAAASAAAAWVRAVTASRHGEKAAYASWAARATASVAVLPSAGCCSPPRGGATAAASGVASSGTVVLVGGGSGSELDGGSVVDGSVKTDGAVVVVVGALDDVDGAVVADVVEG